MFPFRILNVMDAFVGLVLITEQARVSLVCTPPPAPPEQIVRFFGAKNICLASTMDSTMWRVSLQCFTDDVEVLLNGGTW